MAIGAGTGAALGGGAAAGAAGVISLGLAMPPVGVAVAIGSALGPLLASGAVIFADEKLHTRAAQEFSQHVKESAARSARQYADSRAADLRAAWGGVSETLHAQLQDLIASVQRHIDDSRTSERTKQEMSEKLYGHEQQIGAFLQPYRSEAQND